MKQFIDIEQVVVSADSIKEVVLKTPLMKNHSESLKWNAEIYFKREDLQHVRSYKIRGAYNKINAMSAYECSKGVVCASAGNHAQGVAFSCAKKKIKGVVFMPIPTPNQKVEQVKMFGQEYIEVVLTGDTFDDASVSAIDYCKKNKMTFIHPFDDLKVIEGQATIGLELLAQTDEPIDFLFLPVGGGGLAAGVSSVFRILSPNTKIIGVEPMGAPSMSNSIHQGSNVALENIDKFIDGASVKQVGAINFDICNINLSEMALVHEGKVCQTLLDLYNKEAIVVEPAGAMTVAVLEQYKDEIKGKNVICLISGSNNDVTRFEEIKERAMLYAGLKHYFIVRFPQRPGALREFITDVVGPKDNITHFEYYKKHNRNTGPAIVGIELYQARDIEGLKTRMKEKNFFGEYLNDKPDLFQFLV